MPSWGWYACLLVAPVVLLAPFRHAGFVADDFLFAATPAASLLDTLTSRWAHPLGITVAYRPVAALSYQVNQLAFGRDPVGFHLFNYLLHGANAALLALVVRRVTLSTLSAVVAGVVFAMHPVTHESVLWISGRTYPLAALFSLSAVAWVLRERAQPAGKMDHVVLAALVMLALLSYEAALVLPVVLSSVALLRGGRRSLLCLTPWLALLAYLAVRYTVFTTPTDDLWLHLSRPANEFGSAPMFERIRVNSIGFVSRLMATGLGRTPLQSTTFGITLVAMVALAWTVVRQRQLSQAAGIALVLTVVSFIPFASYIGFADRFAYLSAAGIAMFVGVGVGAAWSSMRLRLIVCCLVTAMLTLWGRQYALAARDWVAAGQIAQDLLTDLHDTIPSPAQGAHLHFVDVPYRHGAGLVFITYLDRAVNLSYDRFDLAVTTGQLRQGNRCATVLRWIPSNAEHGLGELRREAAGGEDCGPL